MPAADAGGVALHVAQERSRARRSARRSARASRATSGNRRRSRRARTRPRDRRGRRGPTPAGSARATAARRRAPRSGRSSDRSPSRTPRWPRSTSASSLMNASWLRWRSRRRAPRDTAARACRSDDSHVGQRVHFLARRAVDDPGLAAVAREHLLQLLLQRPRAAGRGRRDWDDRTSRRARPRRAAPAAPRCRAAPGRSPSR